MRGYVLRKLGQTVLTIFVVLVLNFFLFRIMPGNPIRILIRNPKISAESLQRIAEQFGLNPACPFSSPTTCATSSGGTWAIPLSTASRSSM